MARDPDDVTWDIGAPLASLRLEWPNHSETCVGCTVVEMVWRSSRAMLSRSTSYRNLPVNCSTTRTLSYRDRLNCRSTTAWARCRTGTNMPAAANVAEATTKSDSSSNTVDGTTATSMYTAARTVVTTA